MYKLEIHPYKGAVVLGFGDVKGGVDRKKNAPVSPLVNIPYPDFIWAGKLQGSFKVPYPG